jgi:hypothetical protein
MRFIQDNLIALFATLALTAAIICWYAIPEPVVSKPLSYAAQNWNLPELKVNDRQKSIDAITTRNLWGVVAQASTAPKEPVWNVLGIARSGAERFVLLAFEGKPIEILKVGDALPDGIKIVQIENDRFFVRTADHKKIAFGIYKNVPAK